MSDTALFILAPSDESQEVAKKIASFLKCHVVTSNNLFQDEKTTMSLRPEHAICLVSETACSLAKLGSVVLGAPVKLWGYYNKKELKFNIVQKMKKMLCNRRLIVYILMPVYNTDVQLSTWEEDPIGFFNLPNDTIILEHELDNTLSDCIKSSLNHYLQSETPPRPSCMLLCNQIRLVYLHNEVGRHETVFFDAHDTQAVNLDKLNCIIRQEFEARHVTIEGSNGCSLIVLPPRNFQDELRYGQHITIDPGSNASGKRKPVAMRAVAKSLEKDDNECVIADDVIDLTKRSNLKTFITPIAWAFDVFV